MVARIDQDKEENSKMKFTPDGLNISHNSEGDKPMEEVNHPEHYRPGQYEAIKVIEAWGLGFNRGNAVKYISRHGRKSKSINKKD